MRIRNLLIVFIFGGLAACTQSEEDPLLNKPTIFGLGVSMADIPLQHAVQPRLFVEFGLPTESGENGLKFIAHPEFYMPMGTATVKAVSDGKVRDIIELGGPTDILIMVTPDDAPQWTIGYEHVSNVTVSKGDRVSVGQSIADLSPLNSQFFQGYGKTSLMIFVDSNDRSDNLIYCPFLLLDESVRQPIYNELNNHIQVWEQNKGDAIFDTNSWYSTGCFVEILNN